MSRMHARYYALIPAAGGGSRFGAALPKQYTLLAGEPLLLHAVLAPEDRHWASLIGERERVTVLHCGEATRAGSVRNGLRLMRGEAHERDWVLVHDAARPCLSADDLRRLMVELSDDAVGGILGVPVADTLKRADPGGRIVETPSRASLWQAQTPQMFRYGLLLEAMMSEAALDVTDEAQAVEGLGLKPRLVEGSRSNIKVTYAADLALAEAIMQAQGRKERR
jgi:2-C-methyl-D-erythritol 4-phosphate cytidylyltransferase